MEYNNENMTEKLPDASIAKSRILLYTAVFFVAFSIYTFDSFSTWKFFAVIIPLGFSFISYRGKWIFIPVLVIIWFAFMIMSVGVIYNHDIMELSGPIVCPEGYRAEVSVVVQNPVPGETYTSARMRCVNDSGDVINPGSSPHFTVLGLYLIPALILFLINILFFRLAGTMIKNPYTLYLSGSILFCFLARLIWINRDQIILMIKSFIS